jgi:hypothetical protein
MDFKRAKIKQKAFFCIKNEKIPSKKTARLRGFFGRYFCYNKILKIPKLILGRILSTAALGYQNKIGGSLSAAAADLLSIMSQKKIRRIG